MRARAVAVAAAVVLTLAGCGTGGSESVPPDNIAAGADDAPVTPPVDPRASAGESGLADGIRPAPGVTPEASAVPPAFDFAGTTVGGEEFEGADLAGRPAVLWFWAPWCSTCRSQISQVQALSAAYGDEVAFVGVGSLDADAAIDRFAADVQAPAMTQLADPEGLVWRHFGTTAQSTFLVVDGDGARVDAGYLSEADLSSAIRTALG